MPVPRPLRHDPIQEAIVDFRAAETAISRAEDVESVASQLSQRFPKREERRRVDTQVRLRDGKFAIESQDEGFFGLFLKAQDDLTIAQFRSDGFTLNRLKPYPGWSEVLPQALTLWESYVAVAKPTHVSRIALRYINRLDIPLTAGRDLRIYLRSAPDVPPELPQEVNGFQTLVRLVNGELQANVGQRLEESTPDRMVVILDLDVYVTGELAVDASSVTVVLQSLREFKNQLFFELLTERTLGFYE